MSFTCHFVQSKKERNSASYLCFVSERKQRIFKQSLKQKFDDEKINLDDGRVNSISFVQLICISWKQLFCTFTSFPLYNSFAEVV